MLLLVIQHKLFHVNGSDIVDFIVALHGSDIVDFIVALRMLTRSLIIRRRVEDLQLSKWEDVIVIADVDVPKEVRERNNNVELKEEHVTVDVPNQYDVQSDDDVPVASIKRNETKNQNPWPFDDEVVDEDEGEDEVAEEDEVDDEDEWLEPIFDYVSLKSYCYCLIGV
nr:hypothetical protein [Tanacetum cinerariifolium]